MRNIFALLVCLSFYGFASEINNSIVVKPIQIGIASLDIKQNHTLSIYMINQEPVSGIQLELEPKGFFAVDSVYGGIAEINGFSLHYNKAGRILAFSMKGNAIPASKSSNKEDNILFNVSFSPLSNFSLINEHITIFVHFSEKIFRMLFTHFVTGEVNN